MIPTEPPRGTVPAPAAVPTVTGLRAPRYDVADRPFLVIWEATQACPLACRHCRAEARPSRDARELDTEAAKELMRQIAAFGRPHPLFVITGGDPFQRPDLYELVRYGTELGLAVAVSPSGTPTLTREALAGLREAGARALSLSLDAPTAAGHDAFRGVPGVFDWTLDAWRAAVEMGFKVQINTTVTRDNVGTLPDVAALVRERGATLWSVFFLVPTGRGERLAGLGAREAEDLLNALYDLGDAMAVKTTEGHHFRRVCLQRQVLSERGADHRAVLGLGPLYDALHARLDALGLIEKSRVRRPPMQVSGARGFVFVSHVGGVHPTGFLPLCAGNVRQRPLAEIYRTSPLFRGLRDVARLTGRCGACEFRTVCGGSRARAYATGGDPYAEEPACAYQPGSFPYQEDLRVLLGERG